MIFKRQKIFGTRKRLAILQMKSVPIFIWKFHFLQQNKTNRSTQMCFQKEREKEREKGVVWKFGANANKKKQKRNQSFCKWPCGGQIVSTSKVTKGDKTNVREETTHTKILFLLIIFYGKIWNSRSSVVKSNFNCVLVARRLKGTV